MSIATAAEVLLALVALSAIAVGWVREDYRPVAIFLSFGCSADWMRRALALGPLAAPGPYAGAARAAFHLEQALFLAWPAGLCALMVWLFLGRRPRLVALVALAYACVVGACVLGYPALRGPLLRRAYLGADIVALCVCTGATIDWVRLLAPGERVRLPQASAAYLFGMEVVVLFGAFFGDLFTTWDRAQLAHVLFYPALLLLQGGALWTSRSSCKSA
jgi:hypothetical protein